MGGAGSQEPLIIDRLIDGLANGGDRDVIRRRGLHGQHLELQQVDELDGQPGIENVLVE